jgi:hypothetical protein
MSNEVCDDASSVPVKVILAWPDTPVSTMLTYVQALHDPGWAC